MVNYSTTFDSVTNQYFCLKQKNKKLNCTNLVCKTKTLIMKSIYLTTTVNPHCMPAKAILDQIEEGFRQTCLKHPFWESTTLDPIDIPPLEDQSPQCENQSSLEKQTPQFATNKSTIN